MTERPTERVGHVAERGHCNGHAFPATRRLTQSKATAHPIHRTPLDPNTVTAPRTGGHRATHDTRRPPTWQRPEFFGSVLSARTAAHAPRPTLRRLYRRSSPPSTLCCAARVAARPSRRPSRRSPLGAMCRCVSSEARAVIPSAQKRYSGSTAMAHANLARRVLGNCFWMGTSCFLHHAIVMRGSL